MTIPDTIKEPHGPVFMVVSSYSLFLGKSEVWKEQPLCLDFAKKKKKKERNKSIETKALRYGCRLKALDSNTCLVFAALQGRMKLI